MRKLTKSQVEAISERWALPEATFAAKPTNEILSQFGLALVDIKKLTSHIDVLQAALYECQLMIDNYPSRDQFIRTISHRLQELLR